MRPGPDRARRRQVEEVFEAALDLSAHDRATFVDRACAGDEELAARVRALLAAHERPGGVLERDPPGPPLEEGVAGVRYGPYRVLRRLGSGGMGEVFLAVREDAFLRRVALKVIRGGPWSETASERFETERQIMASLNHPNIAQLLDGGVTVDGVPYLAMEYVDGLPVTAYCDRESLTVAERLGLFRKICSAVHHAHQNLVIHRDLKPSNILVTPTGEPKLLDFGIAKLLQPVSTRLGQPVTRPDLRALTPEYASPEQLRGEPLTTASDVFSLGILLYELLTGGHPFTGGATAPSRLAEAVCKRDPVRPSDGVAARVEEDPDGARRVAAVRGTTSNSLSSRLRGDLDVIVMMALRKEPGRRYASVEQMSEDVGRHLGGAPVLAYGEGRVYRIGKFLRRHRLEVVAAAAVLASLLSGLSMATWQARRARAERDRATEALQRAEASADFLVGLFQADDPRQVLADTLSARTMLERGLERVEALDEYPELRGRLRTVVGRAYRSLGAYDRADEVLSAAVRDLRDAGDDSTNAAEARAEGVALAELAEVRTVIGRYDEALALARDAREVRVQRLGPEDPDVAASLLQLGSILVYLGDLDAADSLTRAAVRVRREVLGDEDPMVTNAIETVAALARRRGEIDEAETLLREVVARRRNLEGADSPAHAVTLVRLANLLAQERGDYAEAEAMYRRALLILDPSAPETATTMAGLAEALAAQGRWGEAQDLYEGAVGLRTSLYGADGVPVADLLHGKGLVLLGAGDLDGAEAAHRRALTIWEGALGPEHPAVAYAFTGLARVAAARGQWDRAEALALQALAVRRDALPEGSALIGATEAVQGEIVAERGDLERADSILVDALASLRSTLPEGHKDVRAVHADLASLYEREGRQAEAAPPRALGGGPPPGG